MPGLQTESRLCKMDFISVFVCSKDFRGLYGVLLSSPALLFDYVRASFHVHQTNPNSHCFCFLFPAVGMGNMVSYLVISTLLSNLCIHFVCSILTVFVNLTWFSPFHSAKDFLNRPDYFKTVICFILAQSYICFISVHLCLHVRADDKK